MTRTNLTFPVKLTGMAAALAVALLGMAGSASAIGLKQAYEAALRNDPTYRVAGFEFAAGQENKTIARANLLPSVSASYSNSKIHSDVDGRDIGSNPNITHPKYNSRSASISLRQPLFSMEAAARYRTGVAQSKYSEYQFAGQGQELVLRLTGAYIDALFAEEQLQLATAQRDTLAEQKRVNERYFEKGEGTRTDMLETQARFNLAEAQVIEARDARDANRAALAAIMGQEVDGIDRLNADFRILPLPTGGVEAFKASARERNPELQAQSQAIEIAKQEIKRNQAGHAPRLDFVSSYSKNNAETINTYDQQTTQRQIGIQLSVPLYAGGAVNASTRQAVAGRERAIADLQARNDKVMLELTKQYNQVQSSVARIAALVQAVESGNLLVKATEQSIKGGVRINLDLLNAQQQLYASKRDLAQARYNYLISTLRLRAAAGTLGVDDVNEIATYFR